MLSFYIIVLEAVKGISLYFALFEFTVAVLAYRIWCPYVMNYAICSVIADKKMYN